MNNIELNSDGFFVYKSIPEPAKREITEGAYTYNGVVLPPIPGTCRRTV